MLGAKSNDFELQWGATNSNAALGSGNLTATVSICGELSSLKFPGPSYSDQLDYISDNAPDARLRPHMGATDSAGAFPGIAYETSTGSGFTWLRDGEWSHEQEYASNDSDVVVTRMTNAALGLSVTARQWILPSNNVLVNDYAIERAATSPVRSARLIYYANLSPSLDLIPRFQIADWALDFKNDYLAAYDSRERAVLHWLPKAKIGFPHDFGAANAVLRDPPSDRATLRQRAEALIDAATGQGAYLAVGDRDGDDGYQIGFDDADTCALQAEALERTVLAFNLDDTFKDFVRYLYSCVAVVGDPAGPLAQCRQANGWTYEAQSAYADAADGALSGSPLAACQANEALAHDLDFVDGQAMATFYVAAAETKAQAFALLDEARATSTSSQLAETESWWSDFLAPARLPNTDDADVIAFAKRSLIATRTATDNASGAIVASVNTQPPYGADWPRDGAFINYALDLAGYPEMVSRHNRFYVRVQRKHPTAWSVLYDFGTCDPNAPVYPNCVPAGTFEANYYGTPVGSVPALLVSFEIDEAGLAIWTMWDHARFISDPAQQAAYLGEVCPAIHLGAVNLAACRDDSNGLQCIANEDDNIPVSQGLQGAETVLLALRSAIEAASACGFDAAEVASWTTRAAELEGAMRAHFIFDAPVPHFSGGDREAWMLWPVRFLAPEDPLMASHSRYLHDRFIAPILDRTAPEFSYNTESLLARAQFMRQRGDEAGLAEIREQVRFFIRELTTPGTHHLAEAAGRIDDVDIDGDGILPDYLPQNDVPHIWEHAYLYAAAMIAFGAEP